MLSKIFGKRRPVPMRPEPKLEDKQMSLQDFNSEGPSGNVMKELDVNHIVLGRGEGYDEEE